MSDSVKNGTDVLEASILRVDKYYRITLPQSVLHRIGWIRGDQAHSGWLVVGNPGRCRLVSTAEADNDPECRLLRARIDSVVRTPATNSLEFHDEVLVALALRFLPVQITPPGPGWRLSLPKPLAAIMQIRPGESDVAALSFQEHIEIWTIDTLRSSQTTPLAELI